MKGSFRTKLRQLWVPPEFRLPEPEFTKEQIDLLEELIQMITPNLSRAENAKKEGQLRMATFLVDLGTGVWKIRRKIEGLSRMPKEIRDALYSLESMWMSMSDGGVEIIDHIGTIPSKHEAKIVETREITGLTREQVVDAVKPTILLRGEVVQLGEVILGKPASSSDAITYRADISAPEPQAGDETDEEPAPVHEVETLTFEPPAKAWAAETEAHPPMEEIAPIPAQNPQTEGEAAAKEEDPAIRGEATETGGGLRLDSETEEAAEAAARETSAEAAAGEVDSPEGTAAAGKDEPEETQPEKPKRRGKPAAKAKQPAPEGATETKEDDAASAKRKKTRAAATAIKKTRQSRASSSAKTTPKRSGEEEA